MRRWRVHEPRAAAGEPEILLSEEESHHLVRVLRSSAGDHVGVFDGHGREWDAEILGFDGAAVRVRLGDELDDPVDPPVEITLVQGWCRAERFEWILEKGTEVGISAFQPVWTERSERHRGRVRAERWRRIVVEASKQSGRRVVPSVRPPVELDPGSVDAPVRMTLDPTGDPGAIDRAIGRGRPISAALAVGPESGFSPDELAAFERHGWERVRLGPRILRVETAGPVAAAIILHAWDDRGRPAIA